MEESWYEKLHDWDQALDVYEKKMMTNPEKIELAMGKMRCLEALGEWSAKKRKIFDARLSEMLSFQGSTLLFGQGSLGRRKAGNATPNGANVGGVRVGIGSVGRHGRVRLFHSSRHARGRFLSSRDGPSPGPLCLSSEGRYSTEKGTPPRDSMRLVLSALTRREMCLILS